MERRQFLKLFGESAAAIICFPHLRLNQVYSIGHTARETLRDEVEYTWGKSILVYSNERKLVNFLNSFADEIDCMTVLGNPDHPDLVAIPQFISIVDLDYISEDQWNFYLSMLEEDYEEGYSEHPILLINGWHVETSMSHMSHIRKVRSNDYSLITRLIIDQKSKISCTQRATRCILYG